MRKLFLVPIIAILFSVGIKAQVSSSPSPLQVDSEDVYIYFHADEGSKGLMGVTPPEQVYAHTGVTVNGEDWQYAPQWLDNSTKYEMTFVEPNVWKLYIGNIRQYYGITDPDAKITKLWFVFRNKDGKKEGKGSGWKDLSLDVLDTGLQISLMSDGLSDQVINGLETSTRFIVSVTREAEITLSVNDEIIGTADNTSLSVDYTFPAPGDYMVEATAKTGDKTVSVTKSFCYVKASEEREYPGGNPVMGPVKNDDGSVTFCLAAPEKFNVVLIGAWNGYKVTNDQNMYYTDVAVTNPVNDNTVTSRFFWITIPDLDNSTQYGYYFATIGENGTTRVGDPYARLVLDPWNDKYLLTDVYPDLPQYPFESVDDVPLAIYQGNINDYEWKIEDFKGEAGSDLIIYELLFRDFTGTEGQALGNGTVRQAMAKIPYLKSLGVNAIEVLPIYEFDGNLSWGYNPNFYFAPDKAYGTPDDYKAFIDECHRYGMAVILDMVFNQSSGLHPWYVMYGGIAGSPFYNNFPGLGENGSPHAYSVFNDWNQDYPLVQKYWEDVLTYWLTEYKFDGFRFDLVKGLGQNASYALTSANRFNLDEATNAYNSTRVDEMRYLQGIVEKINPNAYFINENLAGEKEENEMAATGQLNWANVNYAACQFAMGYQDGCDMNRLYAPDDKRTWGSTVSYLESHDEQRLAYKQERWGVNGIKDNVKASMQRLGAAAAQMILSPGAHMIWQFSEMGNAENNKNDDDSNNTGNKTVNWSLLDEPNHKGLFESYSELISIRNRYRYMFDESVDFRLNCDRSDWSNGRSLVSTKGDEQIITAINPNVTGNITIKFNFVSPDNTDYQILSKSYDSNPSFDASAGTITVPANCYVTIGTTNLVAGIKENKAEETGNFLRAYGAKGRIVVDYAYAGATAYSLDGRVVGTTRENGEIYAAPGIYVIKSGSFTLKVTVK